MEISPDIHYEEKILTVEDLVIQKKFRDAKLLSYINKILLLNPNKLLDGKEVPVDLSVYPGQDTKYHKPTWKAIEALFADSKHWELRVDYEKDEHAYFKLLNL